MSGFLLIDDGTDRPRWLEARTGGVSATDAARIMTGGAQTWASLRKEKASGKGFGGNAYTRHGNEREAIIAEFARDQFGLIPSKALIAHAGNLADLATPDALARPTVDGLGILEMGGLIPGVRYTTDEFGEYKTTVHDWPTWADVPKRYFWQVVWQFYVTGARRCRFVFEAHEGFVPLHMEPRVFTIERSDVAEDIDVAVQRVGEWRDAGNEDVELPEALLPLDALLSAHAKAKEEADASNARVDALGSQVRALLEAHGAEVRFEGSDANVTWTGKPGTRTGFDKKAFEAKYPAAARRFTTSTPTQPRLTITARSNA